jgi:hypothetical protein
MTTNAVTDGGIVSNFRGLFSALGDGHMFASVAIAEGKSIRGVTML